MSKKLMQKKEMKERRRGRVRAKVFGTAKRPRLNVFRSLKHLFVQLIDDQKGVTLCSASDAEIAGKLKKSEVASKVGELIAVKAKKIGIAAVVFDTAGHKYHGRVKAVADGARQGGLIF